MEYYLIEIIHYFIGTLSNADKKLNGVEIIEHKRIVLRLTQMLVNRELD